MGGIAKNATSQGSSIWRAGECFSDPKTIDPPGEMSLGDP